MHSNTKLPDRFTARRFTDSLQCCVDAHFTTRPFFATLGPAQLVLLADGAGMLPAPPPLPPGGVQVRVEEVMSMAERYMSLIEWSHAVGNSARGLSLAPMYLLRVVCACQLSWESVHPCK